jgi:hypothetical protein
MAAYAIFSYSELDQVCLVLLDFDVLPWSGGVLPSIVARLDEPSEAITATALARGKRAMQAPSIFVEVPGQLVDAAVIAVQTVFGARLDAMYRSGRIERIIDVLTIDSTLFEDPVRLMLNAGAHVSGGRVKLSKVALARSSELPLFGSLALKPGEDVMADVLRVAMLAAIASLDPAPGRTQGAAVRFG